VGRYRPFKAPPYLDQVAPFYVEPFRGGVPGLFNQTNLSFPSGHGCLAFALATALAILLPKHGRWFYAAATLTAVERFAENAHHLSDSIASAAMGVGAAWAVWVVANKTQAAGTDAGGNDMGGMVKGQGSTFEE
jgi:membrane-associated phospholipid phosphatase